MNFLSHIKLFLKNFFGKNSSGISHEMQTEGEKWKKIYLNRAAWLKSEFSRLVFAESEIVTAEKSRFTAVFDDFMNDLKNEFETAPALGGMMFKPYISHGKIHIDLIRADCFLPVSFTKNQMTSAVFVSRKTVGNFHFTLLEFHEFDEKNRSHTIKNKVCKSLNGDFLGAECGFDEVPEWSGLVPEITFRNVEKPLFSYFRVPSANDIDLDSPLGISVYSRAVDLIREADEQWARIRWEFESKETALDVGTDLIDDGKLPKREKRIYRKFDTDNLGGNFYNVFSPEIRDISHFNYFNRILQRIEFNCGLAYGTLSDPQLIEKTAEEIRTSKQRSYTQVSAVQKSLENAIKNLFYAVSVYAKIGGISANFDISFTWGDSVLEDTDKEFQRRLQLVNSGILKKEKFVEWYFSCNDAGEFLPEKSGLFGEF